MMKWLLSLSWKVNFWKNCATCHAVIEGLHVEKGIPVGYSNSAQAAVVPTGAPRAIFLGYQVQRGHPRRVGAVNNCIAPVVWSFLSTTAQLHATHKRGSGRRKRHFAKCTGMRPWWRGLRRLRVTSRAGRVVLSRHTPPPLIVRSQGQKSVTFRKSG